MTIECSIENFQLSEDSEKSPVQLLPQEAKIDLRYFEGECDGI
jgi:hypothetical protein